MTKQTSQKLNSFTKQNFFNSNIFRIIGFVLILIIYYLSLSPFVESKLTNSLSNWLKSDSHIEINSLTPVFDIHVYAGEYDLKTQLTGSSLQGSTKIFTIDPRILALNKFLLDYHSPMAPYAEIFITQADKYGLDWRLVVSISGVESAFGNIIPRNSNNAWGWRGINRNDAGWSMFASWPDAISHITQRIALGYGTTITPLQMESTYCPPCGQNPQHLWAGGVTRFMNQLNYYVNNLDND